MLLFFNGGREVQYDGEERILVPSPKVATYDLKPEMSVHEVASAVASSLASGNFDFLMCNFAPPDMVGHTGCYSATLKAIEATDEAIGKVFESCKSSGYALFITSDHGNAEKMLSDDGSQPHTAHTCSKVPFIGVIPTHQRHSLTRYMQSPSLRDVCPTILNYMGLPVAPEMDGQILTI